MNYRETLNYLYSQLPMFQRIGAAAYKANLKNIQQLCEKLNHPEQKLKFIHIAGTNGKGSVSNMLAAIFQKNGYKTGLFTSPHLIDFRERIKINGKMISRQYITKFVNTYKPLFDEIKPSFFEWTTALAFQYFYDKKVDIVICETGMGGRLDSTNVVLPELSIITNIGEDHKQFLGDTLQQIAFEKAGIIKPRIPVLISEYQKEVKDVFEKIAQDKETILFYTSDIVKITNYKNTGKYLEISYKINMNNLIKKLEKSKYSLNINLKNNLENTKKKFRLTKNKYLDKPKNKIQTLKSSLLSNYQLKNIPCVIAACEIMKLSGWKLTQPRLHSAIQHTPKITGFRGRWEIIQKNPYVILDIAHNKPGIQTTLKNLQHYKYKKLRIIFGVVSDKDVDEILKLLPKKATYYITQASVPRALPVTILHNKMQMLKFTAHPYSTVSCAIQKALFDAHKNDLILIFGSAFIVADALAYFETKT